MLSVGQEGLKVRRVGQMSGTRLAFSGFMLYSHSRSRSKSGRYTQRRRSAKNEVGTVIYFFLVAFFFLAFVGFFAAFFAFGCSENEG